MNEKPKILVCGDVDGKFKILFSRVETINKKNGPFDLLICTGNFFGSSRGNWEPYQRGTLSVPVPTYILGPNIPGHEVFYPDINGGELCANVNYMGKRGLFSSLSGLKVAYVSGVEAAEQGDRNTFTESDVTTVRDICIRGQSNFKGVDILVTSSWPTGVMNLDRRKDLQEPKGSSMLSWLAAHIKPRYHFCAQEGFYYERRPYRNHNESGDSLEHATRFIALAKVGNPGKQKWLYALSMEPLDKMKASILYQQTTDETKCPYTGSILQDNLNVKQGKQSQYFYDMNASVDDYHSKKRPRKTDHGAEKKPRPSFDQGTCWFCLASPDVEKHLVISIGNEVYLALAKGALISDHVLILPVVHHQSLSCVPESVFREIEEFKTALGKFFNKLQKVPVYYERNYKTSHLQIQVIPVDSHIASQLKEIFQENADSEGFQLDELPKHAQLSQIAPPGTPYFYLELPTGEKLFHHIRKAFPLQFGRDVLASEPILDMPNRADWRDCKMSKEEEIALVKKFRLAYQEFDFTLM